MILVTFLGAIALGLLMNALRALLLGLILMLTVMVVHDDWLPSVPTVGYWVAVLVAFAVSSIVTPVSASS